MLRLKVTKMRYDKLVQWAKSKGLKLIPPDDRMSSEGPTIILSSRNPRRSVTSDPLQPAAEGNSQQDGMVDATPAVPTPVTGPPSSLPQGGMPTRNSKTPSAETPAIPKPSSYRGPRCIPPEVGEARIRSSVPSSPSPEKSPFGSEPGAPKASMLSEKKGFSGLDDLVSDISEDLHQQPAKQTDTTGPAPRPDLEPESRLAQPANSSPAPQASAQPSLPSSGWSGSWVIGIAVSVVLLVIVFATGGRDDKTPSQSQYPAPAAPLPSVYALGISDISSDQESSLDALLQAGQAGDETAIKNAASAIETMSKKSSIDKAVYKDSRAKNTSGLQHHKEGHDDLAAKELFAAYKLNPFDPEISDNLGYVLYNVGDYPAAKKAYLTALSCSVRRASAWVGLAKIFALNDDADRATKAFALAFRFSKAPKTLRQMLLASYREEKIPTVKRAIGAALAAHYASAVAQVLKPALGNLSNVEIPIFLPTKFAPLDFYGKPLTAYAQNNGMFSIETTADSFTIPFGSESDCLAMACGAGSISARKILPTDADEGESVDLEGRIKGLIVKGTYRQTDHLVFRIGNVRYTFSLGSAPEANIEAANSALKLGAIPNEILGNLPKMAMTSPPPPKPVARYPSAPQPSPVPAPLPTQGFVRPPSNLYCTTAYEITLETFGEGVSVELRKGHPGSSTIVDLANSSGGNVRFNGLCAGPYFLAIGNIDIVSVTPVRNFENDMEYHSSIRMQRGGGNVSPRRRNEL